jgi:hypothetical protein
MKREILLVGSVPLRSATEVFETCACILGPRVRRLPDGETGERSNWIMWQRTLLAACPVLELLEQAGTLFRLRADRTAPPCFAALGFAKAALRSWDEFRALRASGRVAAKHRFQVSLPTPLAVVAQYIEAGSQAECEPPYAAALEAELREILSVIPAADLALQWDVAVEFAVLEGLRPIHFTPVFDGIVARLRHLLSLVPDEVHLGIHLCYGDSGHKHFKEPDDTALMVRVANALVDASARRLDWIHMPVPRDRDDQPYFQPLRDLHLSPACRLFLGLVHDEDGLEGTRRRIAAAERFAPSDFGIATECGFGRRDPAGVPSLLRLHVDV